MFEARASGQSSLSIVLGLIHEHRAITRSEICAITGLSRSTVAKLLTTLVNLGFASDTGAEQIDRVGRPSMGVDASKELLAISVHPEVDYLEVKAVAFNGTIVHSEKRLYDEPIGAHQAVEDMVQVIDSLVAELEQLEEQQREHMKRQAAGTPTCGGWLSTCPRTGPAWRVSARQHPCDKKNTTCVHGIIQICTVY
jgi:hypothetical protein